ncbi:gap junction Cx32.2 protein-like [Dunckerocampus dactyliophorus]|uniref:gap junction Cx32.2 protein-like n=1 Tax=Dunckerocampus dactyliophorus TaxID=161453 RepID=UPI0024073B6C|nr:gap junction Cx32.2 protein-like [Dunckerocampus dactyliophorus]
MSDWSYLSKLLIKVQAHSTVVGKIWMSVLFLFRIFVLGAAADNVWADEVSEFYCDSKEPGCQNACYNAMFPMSYVHYWVLQITFVSTPTLVYLAHAVLVIHKEKKMLEQEQSKASGNIVNKGKKYTDDRGKVKIKGILFYTYLTQLVFKIILEVGFTVGQFYVFGPLVIVSNFHCKKWPPCAHDIGSRCFISRPTEKTIFIFFMLVVTGVSVLLNIVEIVYLLCNKRQSRKKHLAALPQVHTVTPCTTESTWRVMSSQYGGYPLLPLPAQVKTHMGGDDSHIHAE